MNDSSLQDAFLLCRAGKLAEAGEIYSRILLKEPKHFEALYSLGIVRFQLGELEEAERLIAQAVDIQPLHVDAHYNRACLLVRLHRLSEALVGFEQAIRQKPDHVAALSNRGSTFMRLNRYDDALNDYDRVVRLLPGFAQAWYNQAGALFKLKRYSDAIESYDKTIALQPSHIEARKYRAIALLASEKHQDAVAELDRVLKFDPSDGETWTHRGDAFTAMKDPAAALHCYDRALSNGYENAAIWASRGLALLLLRRNEDSLVDFAQAVTIDPNCIAALIGRAGALSNLQRFREATEDCRKAMAIEAGNPSASAILAHCRLHTCDWQAGETEKKAPVALPLDNKALSDSEEDHLRCTRLWIASEGKHARAPLWRGERFAHDKIRIAYLSTDFRAHAVAFLIAGVFEHHDKGRFETTAISLKPSDGSETRARIVSAFDHFTDIREKTDREVAALIRNAEIDIAVDLNGYTGDSRPGILAFRPAPIQVNYLGYPGTMAVEHIDYIVADRVVLPEANARFYREKIAYLPLTYQPNDKKRHVSDHPPNRAQSGLPEQGFVFCCFNHSYKIRPDVFDVWMRLLQRVENSVLWLLDENSAASDNLRRAAEARGVAGSRLVFAKRVPPAEHLARQKLADLFLDTLPYNAHTTASDALWVGLPLVTCQGQSFASRVAASILGAAGLNELVTHSLEEYEKLAEGLARNPDGLPEIKTKLIRSRDTSPLFDIARFTRDLEAAYETMWERHQRGLLPETFAVQNERS